MPRCSQHSGGSDRRGGPTKNSQREQPLLRSADVGQLDRKLPPDPPAPQPPDYRELFENLNTAVILLDANHLITELNPAAENLLGISRSRANGHPFMPLVDDDRKFAEILSRSLTTNVTYASELRLARSEVHPEERIIESRVSPIYASAGEKRLLIEMIDVTRRARISRENALLIQHGAGRQMIRQLAHEIKNPLGGLRGAAQLLGKQLGNAELKEYTQVIISEADRLAGLVDTLLGPGGPPNKQPANVHEVIEYVVRLLAPELEDKLEVVRDYDAGLPTIKLDRGQIIQAFINLMKNAATALEGRGRITLRTRAVMNFTIGETRHPVVATIDIEDDGPGIPPELQDSIFYPLVTSRPDGTGLGLPTAQDLISRHDGLIEFESRPGRTVFSIRIPISSENEVAPHG